MDDAPPGGELHDRIAFAREHPVDPGERAAVLLGHGVILPGVREDIVAHEHDASHRADKFQQLPRAPLRRREIERVVFLGRENFVLQQRRNAVEQEHAVSVGGIQTREDAPRALDRFKVQPRAVGNVAADALIVLGVGRDHRGNVVMLFPRG